MKNNIMMLAVLALGGFAVWQGTKKSAQAAPTLPVIPTEAPKTTTTEGASLPLDVWQSLTQQQLQGLPVTQQTGRVGAETYHKTSAPVAIGDTGFKVWGMTESGAVVVATKDPSAYAAWEWY